MSWVVVLISMVLISGCNPDRRHLREQLRAFQKESITVPPDMLTIQGGRPVPFELSDSLPLLVCYVPSEECSQCRVAQLPEMEELFLLSQETGRFQFLVILSPEADSVDGVRDKLMELNFRYPVCLDMYSEFGQSNNIPHDIRFHFFLTDAPGIPFSSAIQLQMKRSWS